MIYLLFPVGPLLHPMRTSLGLNLNSCNPSACAAPSRLTGYLHITSHKANPAAVAAVPAEEVVWYIRKVQACEGRSGGVAEA